MANSEKTVKEAIVKRYNREGFYLATKLPAWCMKDGSNGDTYERLPSKELLQYLQDKWFIDS